MTTLRVSRQEKVRDQIIRAVRLSLPTEDSQATTTCVLSRLVCPTLTESTWAFVNGVLPEGWSIVELSAKTFRVQVVGRRA